MRRATVKLRAFRAACTGLALGTLAADDAGAGRPRMEPPLLFGGGAPPLRAAGETDPRLPKGAEFVGRERPRAESRACSPRRPVCVHSLSGVDAERALAALDGLEQAYEKLVLALALPPPIADDFAGGSSALDLYLEAPDDVTPPFERVRVWSEPRPAGFDAAAGFCTAMADDPAHLARSAALCVGEAIALRLDPAETPHLRRAFATELWWLVGTKTNFDVEAVDRVQRAPWLALAERELSERSEGSALLFDYLEDTLSAGEPGALSAALLAASAQDTPRDAESWHNEPDLYDVLRHTLDESEPRLASLFGDLAVARSFSGDRDDGAHGAGLGWAGAFGAPVFDWVVAFSKLPRRVKLTPIEPTGAGLVWLDVDRPRPGVTLAFQAEWEPPAMFRWQLVKIGSDGSEKGRLDVPFQERQTKVEARIVDLSGVRAVVAVGAHLERVDDQHPFDPDVAPFEPHSALVYFVELDTL